MEIQESDYPQDDGDVAAHRERAAAELDQIARDVKQALTAHGIDTPLFFIVPSASAVITFGTPADPSDDLWTRVVEIVAPIVRQSVGLAGTRCRAVACASTDTIAERQPSPPTAPALQHAGAGR